MKGNQFNKGNCKTSSTSSSSIIHLPPMLCLLYLLLTFVLLPTAYGAEATKNHTLSKVIHIQRHGARSSEHEGMNLTPEGYE